MADVVSSVTSLFSTVLQGFELIQVARTFDDEAGLYQSKLAIIQLRLSRWGEAVGLNPDQQKGGAGEGAPQNGQPSLAISTAEAEIVEEILDNIEQALKKAKEESASWKPAADSKEAEPEEAHLKPKIKRLKAKIQNIVSKRCQDIVTGYNGVKWALYKKEQCEALTTKLLELIENLEKVVAPEKLDELSNSESKIIGESLKTLLEAVVGIDPRLEKAASQTLEDQVETQGISFKTATNYGIQMGVNRGNMSGLTFGTGNTVYQSYGQNGQGQHGQPGQPGQPPRG